MSRFDWGRRWWRSRAARPIERAGDPGPVSGVRSPFDRLVDQWRVAAATPLKPFPLTAFSANNAAIPGGFAFSGADRTEAEGSLRAPAQARDFYNELAAMGLPPRTSRAVHAFVATLPSWLAPPTARRHGESGIELGWSTNDGRRFRARIAEDGMVIYSARLGDRGRFDGAEPIGDRLSPIVLHAIRQLAL
jgi:hypothetical protein